MGHEHGSEYQLKIILHNGNEELTGWLNQEQLAVALTAARPKAKAIWLQERNVLCGSCLDRAQSVLEYPVSHTDSTRHRPRDSRYLTAAGVRNRGEVFPSR